MKLELRFLPNAFRHGVTEDEILEVFLNETVPEFENDREIAKFMESYDGFELADRGLAEIVEIPDYSDKKDIRIELDTETLQLLNELVSEGICNNIRDAGSKAVRSYTLAVLPHSYKLARGK
ncbi:hypothetical protein QUF80_02955 [Desulfococcaceae bacterium HSG8]|nr:hypothetical protein [Desulfococcaceae bacterium HSG8]